MLFLLTRSESAGSLLGSGRIQISDKNGNIRPDPDPDPDPDSESGTSLVKTLFFS